MSQGLIEDAVEAAGMTTYTASAVVLLSLKGVPFAFEFDHTFVLDGPFGEEEAATIRYMWTEGNYSCDCNRADFIRAYCDPEFPETGCGEEIALQYLGLRVVKEGE